MNLIRGLDGRPINAGVALPLHKQLEQILQQPMPPKPEQVLVVLAQRIVMLEQAMGQMQWVSNQMSQQGVQFTMKMVRMQAQIDGQDPDEQAQIFLEGMISQIKANNVAQGLPEELTPEQQEVIDVAAQVDRQSVQEDGQPEGREEGSEEAERQTTDQLGSDVALEGGLESDGEYFVQPSNDRGTAEAAD